MPYDYMFYGFWFECLFSAVHWSCDEVTLLVEIGIVTLFLWRFDHFATLHGSFISWLRLLSSRIMQLCPHSNAHNLKEIPVTPMKPTAKTSPCPSGLLKF